jgi:hypothetical protein
MLDFKSMLPPSSRVLKAVTLIPYRRALPVPVAANVVFDLPMNREAVNVTSARFQAFRNLFSIITACPSFP